MGYGNSENNIDFKFKSCVSFAHLIGCITALIIDYVKAPLPDTFFKTIRTTTEVPYNERAQWVRDVSKKPRPMLVVEPKFDPSDDTKFMPSTEFDMYIPNETDSGIWSTIVIGSPMVVDSDHRFELYNKIAKYKVSFVITFVVDSPVQLMQLQEHIRQNIRHQIPNPLNRYIEHNIPQHFMEAMSLMLDMDVNSDEFITKINEISTTPITHRIRPGSGNKEFFSLTPATLHTLFTSLPSSNGSEKKGKMATSASFTENVEVEFSANSTYYLRTNKNVGEKIDMSGLALLAQSTFKPTSPILPVFEFPVFEDYENKCKRILQINVQFETGESDSVNIEKYINGEIHKMLEYHRNQMIDNTFLTCVVAEESNRLDDSRVTFDPNTCDLTVKNTNIYKNYIVAVYCNYLYVNDLKKSILAFDDFEKSSKN